MVAFSFASINPSNIALMLVGFALVFIYEALKHGIYHGLTFRLKYLGQWIGGSLRSLRPLVVTTLKFIALSIPLNLWWLLPLLNVYFLSSGAALNSDVNAASWAWTQSRASFLNLFWFNGIWGWLPEYYPYFDLYNNPLIVALVFVPFIIGASSLLFKTNKLRFNTLIMSFVVFFIFLAKGLHPPLEGINSILNALPFMGIFREPTSKFTLFIVLLMALLIGYACSHLVKLVRSRLPRYRHFAGIVFSVFFVLVFVVSSFPLIISPSETGDSSQPLNNGPLETRTDMMNYSSYVKIPDYWYSASSWINNQTGDFKVLFSPLNDFYLLPYTWGYWGTDNLFYRLFDKPVVSTDYLYGYVLRNGTADFLNAFSYSLISQNGSSFRDYLDLLNIRYVLQRNDLDTSNRRMLGPGEMTNFLSNQSYLELVETFGKIDVYEYRFAKPAIYAYPQTVLDKVDYEIWKQNSTVFYSNFDSSAEVQAWRNSTDIGNQNSNFVFEISADNGSMKAEKTWTKSNWASFESVEVRSPQIFTSFGDTYRFQVNVTVDDRYDVFLRILEFNGTIVNGQEISFEGQGISEDGREISYREPTSQAISFGNSTGLHSAGLQMEFSPSHSTKYIRLIVNFLYTNSSRWSDPDPWVTDRLWIDSVNFTSHSPLLYGEGFSQQFSDYESVEILRIEKISSSKTVLTVNASQPFVIATSQALDDSWIARVDGETLRPYDLYLGFRGFKVDKTGLIDIQIEYEPQVWFDNFLIVSAFALLVCGVLLVYFALPKRLLRLRARGFNN